MSQALVNIFKKQYGTSPEYLVRAPGRVNLIGEHTDYNDGFVMPVAINRGIRIALSPSDVVSVTVYSMDFDQALTFDLSNIEHTNAGWGEYIKGVASLMTRHGFPLSGWKGVICGDLPIGAGLSSSAAVEVAVARAFEAVSGCSPDKKTIARIAQQAEQEWIGVNCGIMDQLISVAGEDQHALLIDCRSLEWEPVPLPSDCLIAVLDTSTRRELADSEYNARRDQCNAAAEMFNATSLRDVPYDLFAEKANSLAPVIRKRTRHVLTENRRTMAAAEAMKVNDPEKLGRLIYESHVSLRDDFEVSSPALNQMVEAAREIPGCYGARMVGAGFGGCAMAIIRPEIADSFVEEVSRRYFEASGLKAAIHLTPVAPGAEIIPVK